MKSEPVSECAFLRSAVEVGVLCAPAPILSISINVYPAPAWWEAAWRGGGGGGLNTITGSIVAGARGRAPTRTPVSA